MSLAYPLVRVLPILLVALISMLLGRGEALSAVSLEGMSLVTVGCFILPLKSFLAFQPQQYLNRTMPWILLAAFGIGYILIDDLALKLLRVPLHVTPSTILYASLQGLSTSLFIWIFLALFERPLKIRLLPVAVLTGLMISATYGLTLAALAFVKDVSYVRQLSIPLGATLGMMIAREPAYRPKLTGIFIVVLGLMLTALG